MILYIVQDKNKEVLPHAFRTPDAAMTFCEGRAGRTFEWRHSDSHGECWGALDDKHWQYPHYDFIISAVTVVEGA